MRVQIKRAICAVLVAFVALGVGVSSGAYATVGGNGGDGNKNIDWHKYTICHRTDSVTNPYASESVDISAIDGIGNSDHYGKHTGPLAYSEVRAEYLKNHHQNWGDIIPPTYVNPAGLNWTPVGQAMWANDCNYPKVATASVTILPATCELGQKLVLGTTTTAIYTGTPNGTFGPIGYNVTATAKAGYLFNNMTSTLTFTGTLTGPLTGEDCSPKPVLKTATAVVNKLAATCTAGEKLSFSNVLNATASGTADGTTGPANFDVTFTANSDAQFDAKGTKTLEFTGSLTGPLTDASCNPGKGSTEVPATPNTPATQTAVQPIKALPYTAGGDSTAVVVGGGLLTTLLGLAGLRRLFGRSL